MENTVYSSPKLFMIMLGCKPKGRHTEQHDIFFTIADAIEQTKPEVLNFWPEAKGRVHMDAWRMVNAVGNYSIKVVPIDAPLTSQEVKLFFINLGGYREGEFDEPHYKLLIVAKDKAAASRQAKQTAFYKHTGFAGAPSHIDDKYGVDVDDAFEITDVLAEQLKAAYRLQITPAENLVADKFTLGYMPLYKV
jgi:hypothetical protein